MLSRRGLITGLISLAAAPAIVRVESLMPIKVIEPIMTLEDYVNRVMSPLIEKLHQQMIDEVMYGTSDLVAIQYMYDNGLIINTIKDERFRC